MPKITLEIAQEHLRFDEDDDSLGFVFEAAVAHVEALTGVANDDDAPRQFGIACLLLTSHWYFNRDIVGQGNRVPYGFEHLILNLRRH